MVWEISFLNALAAPCPFSEVRTLASVPLLSLLDSYLRTTSQQTRQLILPRQSRQQQKYKKEQETWSLSILDSEGFCFISHIKHGGTVHQSGRVMLGDQLVQIDGLDCFGRARDDVNRRVFGTPFAQDTDIVLGCKRDSQDSYEVILWRTFQKATAAPQIVEDTSERQGKESSKKKYRFTGLSPVQREIMRRIKPIHDTEQLSSRTQKDENARMDTE
jgi:hypothetical protein